MRSLGLWKRSSCIHLHQRNYTSTARNRSNLRILFCGADEFSIFSLRALQDLKNEKPDTIAKIDVLCRPDKRVGAGLKKIREVPIKSVARELQLQLHQIDTFTGWTPPDPYDLIVAVSFGLLVPSRILKACTYGGLNVHPSMLPDLRGPAPIQRALLGGRTHTGVSLQTMHPEKFDHGLVLAQTPPPGLEISPESSVASMIDQLGQHGAEMLRDAIADELYKNPSGIQPTTNSDATHIEHAHRLSPEDRHIDWNTWTADKIILRDRILGRLWDRTTIERCNAKENDTMTRTIFAGPWRKIPSNGTQVSESQGAGHPQVLQTGDRTDKSLAFRTADGYFVAPTSATLEGRGKDKGIAQLIRKLGAKSPP